MVEILLRNNLLWAELKRAQDPEFFSRLAAQQKPRYLWIGCADSRVPANEIIGLDPGEVFVHRNIANLCPPADANFLSVLQFATEQLKVRDILVTGHYGCGGVRAAVGGERLGLIDHWLQPIRDVYDEHVSDLQAIADAAAREDRLCELNVLAQVRAVAQNPFVHEAWRRGQELEVHGLIYSVRDGILHSLNVSVTGFDDLKKLFPDRPSALIGASV